MQTDVLESYNLTLAMLWRGLASHLADYRQLAEVEWQQEQELRIVGRLVNAVQRQLILALHAMTGRSFKAIIVYAKALGLCYIRHVVVSHVYILKMLAAMGCGARQNGELGDWLAGQFGFGQVAPGVEIS